MSDFSLSLSAASKMENTYGGLLTDDQYFLLSFIMGTYFGPDIKNEKCQKPALQRCAEGLLLYNADNLANSQIKVISMESIYYYILRKAEKSVVVNQHVLVRFIHGNLQFPVEGPTASYPKFNELFPPALHRHLQYKNQCDTIQSIVFIDNPEISYIGPVNIRRFKSLTRLEDFRLDRKMAMLHIFMENSVFYNVKVEQALKLDGVMQQADGQYSNLPPDSAVLLPGSLQNVSSITNGPMAPSSADAGSKEDFYPGTIFLPSRPSSKEEWSNIAGSIKNGFALTGSASRQNVGPVVGLIDIGESEDSYLFRVSLPGVRRDEKDFSCEVESNGTVLIKGVTVTGERTIERFSHAFEMQTQNLCPPGPFSISFKLPGPVDPQQFHGTFAADGILEGIAVKARENRFIS